jgi:hypothetical protein
MSAGISMWNNKGVQLATAAAVAYAVFKLWGSYSGNASDSEAETFNVEIVQRPAEVYGQRAGRAVGQTLLDSPNASVANGLPNIISGQSIAASRQAGDESVTSTAWEGSMTDTSLKYRVGSFGTNFSGSAIGIAQ